MNAIQRATIGFTAFSLTVGVISAVAQGQSMAVGAIAGAVAMFTVIVLAVGITWMMGGVDGVVGLLNETTEGLGR